MFTCSSEENTTEKGTYLSFKTGSARALVKCNIFVSLNEITQVR